MDNVKKVTLRVHVDTLLYSPMKWALGLTIVFRRAAAPKTCRVIQRAALVAALLESTLGFLNAASQANRDVSQMPSSRIYAELRKRTQSILAAPPADLAWLSMKFTNPLLSRSNQMSVYDDAVNNPSTSSDSALANVSNKELQSTLVRRSEEIKKTLYGKDDRMDLWFVIQERDKAVAAGVQNPRQASWARNAEAVGFIVHEGLLQPYPDGNFYVSVDSYQNALRVCPEERFFDQPCMRGMGTAFVVSPRKVVTAGHCLPPGIPVTELKVIFGYCLQSKQVPASIIIRKEDVYAIAGVEKKNETDDSDDWAVLNLAVSTNRTPVVFGKGMPSKDDPVYAIGYPNGLPLKIAVNGRVRATLQPNNCFVAAVDLAAGNSGSPIFNFNTNEVEGIVVRGNKDFVWIQKEKCMASVVITDNYQGETISTINVVPKP